jgi:hypothetical protein
LAPVHVGRDGRYARAALPATLARGVPDTDTITDALAESHADALRVAIADAFGLPTAIAFGIGIALCRSDAYADANPICFTVFVHDAATPMTDTLGDGATAPSPRETLSIGRPVRLPL